MSKIVYLREIDAGTDNACWVVCAKGDPGAVEFMPPAIAPSAGNAIELPIEDCDLTVAVGRDGVWMYFGPFTAIHVSNSLCERRGIIGSNITKWCVDREEQAKQIRADNSQFGVGT